MITRVISYYTKDTGYEGEVARLISSLKRLSLPHSVEGISDFGDWYLNTQYKPQFVLDKLNEFKSPVLWTDADSIIWETPRLIEQLEKSSTDIAIHRTPRGEFLSGTVWFNYTPTCLALVDKWVKKTSRGGRTWDQVTLGDCIQEGKAATDYLPSEYCYIFDLSKSWARVDRPVVEHFQASRQFAKKERRKITNLIQEKNLPWDKDEIFVVGGGPSLKDFDWSLLDSKTVIAVNRAWEMVPKADILFSIDNRYYESVRYNQLWLDHPGLKVMLDVVKWNYGPEVKIVPGNTKKVIGSLEDGIFPGENSGYAAMCLAIALRAKKVYLLGFDLNSSGVEQKWFHSGYPWSASKDTVYQKFVAHFQKASRFINPGKVINCNPNSGLKCFPFGWPFSTTAPPKKEPEPVPEEIRQKWPCSVLVVYGHREILTDYLEGLSTQDLKEVVGKLTLNDKQQILTTDVLDRKSRKDLIRALNLPVTILRLSSSHDMEPSVLDVVCTSKADFVKKIEEHASIW